MRSAMKRIFLLLTMVIVLMVVYSPQLFTALSNIPAPPSRFLPPPTCRAREHVFFLKTHKCGSSTVQNVLMRYGLVRGLNFVLPAYDNYLGHPEPFSPSHVNPALWPPKGQQFHVLTHHMRYHSTHVADIMPRDTVRITILRDPADQFESLFSYFLLGERQFGNRSLNVLLQLDLADIRILAANSTRYKARIGINQMSFDLGLTPSEFNDPMAVSKLISAVERDFSLVMLAEYMEESLVLLAELLCWPISEVAFLTLNSRSARASLEPQHQDKLRTLNSADWQLYKHFAKIFRMRMLRFGLHRMREQTRKLSDINAIVRDECISHIQVDKWARVPRIEYELKQDAWKFCKFFVMSELNFTHVLRETHLSKIIKYYLKLNNTITIT